MSVSPSDLAILTPIHTTELNERELLRIQISLRNNRGLDHYFIIPEGSDPAKIIANFPTSKFIFLHKSNFFSVNSYNKLMLTRSFYEMFINYTYILILQTDAILIREIQKIDFQNYDYVGAPWKKSFRISMYKGKIQINNKRLFWLRFDKIGVGNGGLSFRRVRRFMHLLDLIEKDSYAANLLDGTVNEDLIVSYFLQKYSMLVPSKSFASKVFLEAGLSDILEIPKVLGFHAAEKFNSEIETRILENYRHNGF